MNRRLHFVLSLLILGSALKLSAQGTAFNYQGRLGDAGSPANGSYDFRFAVFNAVTNGSQISVPLTNSAVAVSNGLFSVTLDFGAGVFTGGSDWLDLAVRATGATNFTALVPRQPVLPVPYAIFATGASNLLGKLAVAQITGNLPASQVSGTSSNLVSFTNGNNSFSGAFTGNGSALSNLNASQLTFGTVADARLSGNVALLNTNQTFTGTNTFTGANVFTSSNQFTGANAFTNLGNSFSGSFFGNGLVGWVVVSGSAVTAASDHGYMLTSSSLTTVTLPLNSALANDDIVRVSGAGTGGWLVAENPGQIILGNFSSYTNSDPLRALTTSSGNTYQDVAASADGTRIYYVGNGFNGVELSADSGNTWSQITGVYFAGSVYSIASSANGKVVYAELGAGGTIMKSTDGGVTWAASGSTATGTSIACSADGSKLFFNANYACSGDGTYLAKRVGSAITISTNGGATFPIAVTAPPGTVNCLAASGDCTRLLAGDTAGLLYASANQGKSWTPLTSTNQYWTGAWMPADGSKLAAAAIVSGVVAGGVYFCNVSAQPNTVSTNSTIGGSQGAAVELQYIGNGRFMPVSSAGTLWAN
ncbi:MAG TPA: sialidase family protein [Verrucomicrobiae bacterium]